MNIISIKDGLTLNIEKKEIYRYLGYHFGGEVPPDEELEKMVEELTVRLKEAVAPRCAYEIFHLVVKDDFCHLSPHNLSTNNLNLHFVAETSPDAFHSASPLLSIKSKNLSNHLKECRQAILFAATIGPGADMLIRRYSGRSTIKPTILQAVGAAAIEAFADEVTEQIRTEISVLHNTAQDLPKNLSAAGNPLSDQKTVKFRMRFSPGYGDFSLSHQTDFFKILQLEKNLGMNLNSALLMSPSKSITAVIGIL